MGMVMFKFKGKIVTGKRRFEIIFWGEWDWKKIWERIIFGGRGGSGLSEGYRSF